MVGKEFGPDGGDTVGSCVSHAGLEDLLGEDLLGEVFVRHCEDGINED